MDIGKGMERGRQAGEVNVLPARGRTGSYAARIRGTTSALLSEGSFRKLLYASGVSVLLLLSAIFISLFVASGPAFKELGFHFLIGRVWDPVANNFGALPFLVGTLLTSLLALIISTVFSLAISIFLGEYFRAGAVSSFIKSVVELLAGIPSVIYGFWGLAFLVPAMRFVEITLGVVPYGVGILTASLILSVMIIPYSASLGREVISLVPSDLKEAALSLGATRFEVVRKIILPYARSGIVAGVLLSLGRALGETMAVTMVIGNSNMLPKSIFGPANTMASIIANEFSEATGKVYLASLIEIALILFVVTAIINIIGRITIIRLSVEK
ncbi:MAG: phosphate ABC transporter permease subunit PstC [Syntrophorhabdales bacterium]|jgi:phosphate transport system permease protein